MDGTCLEEPCASKKLPQSECTLLFMNAYRLRDAGDVIHSHSIHTNLVILLFAGSEFTIKNQEMLKGI
ncbi:methylthioribulose-1-phosphate dehydratase-like protein [Leptotrombidium deliense]|uniref:Methylthioribulose-1-phosphate dehydratase-like protein n=1 Tax=Leptotrombidium deliense TaxID=299467 RepID=A0A443SHP4_9ACAR|nr:methylthioribulose-1-phosphate dehydratase-like protein [Leptotrombidium deliense]